MTTETRLIVSRHLIPRLWAWRGDLKLWERLESVVHEGLEMIV